MLDTNISFH